MGISRPIPAQPHRTLHRSPPMRVCPTGIETFSGRCRTARRKETAIVVSRSPRRLSRRSTTASPVMGRILGSVGGRAWRLRCMRGRFENESSARNHGHPDSAPKNVGFEDRGNHQRSVITQWVCHLFNCQAHRLGGVMGWILYLSGHHLNLSKLCAVLLMLAHGHRDSASVFFSSNG